MKLGVVSKLFGWILVFQLQVSSENLDPTTEVRI